MFLQRHDDRWRDLDWIGDDCAYELHLRFHAKGKAKVLKHCLGIEEFKHFAQGKLAQRK